MPDSSKFLILWPDCLFCFFLFKWKLRFVTKLNYVPNATFCMLCVYMEVQAISSSHSQEDMIPCMFYSLLGSDSCDFYQ